MESAANSPAIEARGLAKRFGRVVAVDGIDVVAARGICLGLLGPNGAGKTTTIEILEGLTAPDSGEVRLLGLDWKRAGREIRSRIGVQLQETRLTDKLTCFELLRLFRSFYREGRTPDEVLALVHLTDKRDSRYEQLSGGQRQRLALACALVNKPDILFLDEPTTGLDPQARRRVWEIIEDFRRAGGTVLLTTHYMDEAERLADRLIILDHGKVIAEGTPRDLIQSLQADAVIELTIEGEGEKEKGAGANDGVLEPSLRALAGVRSVRRAALNYTLGVERLHVALPLVLACVEQHHLALSDLRTHRANLEDLFVSLTGRQLRDE